MKKRRAEQSELPVVKSAKDRTQRVVASIKEAMAAIEAELGDNDGIYPHNRGRISMAEVCRRSGVHEITMMGRAHFETTRPMIISWMRGLTTVMGAATRRRAVTSRADLAEENYRRVASQFQAMYQVEIPKRDAEIARLQTKIAELEAENLRLYEQVSNSRVVRLPSNRRGK